MVIKNIDGEVLFESKANSIKEALEEAVRNRVPLRGAQLNGTTISRACLDEAQLEEATFQRSLLYKVSFCKAHLSEANFFLADLGEASLKDAFLNGAYFRDACLDGANLDAKTPPLDSHRFISEVLWRSAEKGSQKDFAARVRVETCKCWEQFYLLAREKKVLSWAKRVLSKWTTYREQIQSVERRLKKCR